MEKRYKCRECANFLPIEGTVSGHCKVRHSNKELLVTRSRLACKKDFVKTDKIPVVVRVCRLCKKEFVVSDNSRQVFCCDECRIKWFQEERKRERAERKAQKIAEKSAHVSTKAKGKPAKKPKKPKLTISDICRLALAEHLSYGEYVKKYGV